MADSDSSNQELAEAGPIRSIAAASYGANTEQLRADDAARQRHVVHRTAGQQGPATSPSISAPPAADSGAMFINTAAGHGAGSGMLRGPALRVPGTARPASAVTWERLLLILCIASALLFFAPGWVPRYRLLPRSPPHLRVIGAGLPRSGTASMAVAIETLTGEEVMYPLSLMYRPWQMAAWNEYVVDESISKSELWERTLEGYIGVLGAPACYMYQDLMDMYPEAKVVLTVRDATAWCKSARTVHLTLQWILTSLSNIPRLEFSKMNQAIDEMSHGYYTLASQVKDCSDPNEPLIQWYNEWNANVTAAVPHDKLLVFHVGKDGWKELATFLQVPPPAHMPFPHKFKAHGIIFSIVLAAVQHILPVLGLTALFYWICYIILNQSADAFPCISFLFPTEFCARILCPCCAKSRQPQEPRSPSSDSSPREPDNRGTEPGDDSIAWAGITEPSPTNAATTPATASTGGS